MKVSVVCCLCNKNIEINDATKSLELQILEKGWASLELETKHITENYFLCESCWKKIKGLLEENVLEKEELKNKINTIKEVCFELIYKTIDIEKKILSDRKRNREIFYLLEELLDRSADLNWYFHELEDFIAEKFEELKKEKNKKGVVNEN